MIYWGMSGPAQHSDERILKSEQALQKVKDLKVAVTELFQPYLFASIFTGGLLELINASTVLTKLIPQRALDEFSLNQTVMNRLSTATSLGMIASVGACAFIAGKIMMLNFDKIIKKSKSILALQAEVDQLVENGLLIVTQHKTGLSVEKISNGYAEYFREGKKEGGLFFNHHLGSWLFPKLYRSEPKIALPQLKP